MHSKQGCKVFVARTFFESAQGYQNHVFWVYFSFYSSFCFILCDHIFRQSLTTILTKKLHSTVIIWKNVRFGNFGTILAKNRILANWGFRAEFFVWFCGQWLSKAEITKYKASTWMKWKIICINFILETLRRIQKSAGDGYFTTLSMTTMV